MAAEVPAAWVTGDEVYGADPRSRARVREHRLGYVLAVAANRRVPTDAGPIRVDALPALIPEHAWQTHSAGPGRTAPACTPGRGFGCWPKTTPTPAFTIC
ncbi:putative insA [Mycobacterium kansasii 732]|nr:putative insA [Mycobacterium kansasii 732]